ncbi:Aste57867_25530 [Aphanomyces stellatus]|uniref:Aste57867_25530 protein n=1 Tax=Aphanomyces stellatus TaxID=120398 RepID=A0A485LTF8_9STRA|nr:hypothetical protein As57867_025451 [Aphanomyces stellatus]VFU02153.1 Aste57867_25530 [Aphanomyces stellatus]
MQQSKPSPLAWRLMGPANPLPPHLVFQIAMWIEAAPTFTSFLEALDGDRGLLEPFWQHYQVVQDSTTWWPKLQLKTMDSTSYMVIAAIAKHYTDVVILSGE